MTQPLSYATPMPPPKRVRRGLFGWLPLVGFASKVMLDGDEISGQFRSPVRVGAAVVSVFRTHLPADVGHNWTFTQWLLENSPNAEIRAAPSNSILTNFILPFIPWLLILAFIWFFVFRQLRRNSVQPKQPTPVIIVNPERA